MNHARRQFFLSSACGVAVVLAGVGSNAIGASKGSKKEKVVKIEAKKFTYTPSQIVLKKGQAVVLELIAIDFTHGFSIPDMQIRADLMPGQVTRVKLNTDVAGDFDFLCDNFCGSGHETMSGKIIIKA